MSATSAISAQIRVVHALILREVHTLYGHTSLGYLWALIQGAFGIAIIWGIRAIMHSRAPHGMSELTYLATGFCIWIIVSQTISKCMAAVEGNRSLLTFPQITPLDIMISRTVVVWVTSVLNTCIILGIGTMFGRQLAIADINMLISSLVLAGFLGLSLGTLCGALAVFMPVLNNIVPMAMRILFFASGVFFSVTNFPKNVADILLMNPIMQLIEMTRSSMHTGYMVSYIDVEYVVYFIVTLLPVGLLLERYARRKQLL
ncbi:MAG: ABC transporter permease [Syntrophorhabdaceae bacterium]|nr:ABC transporter permease [Syntrophorhabdaceae bacterium]